MEEVSLKQLWSPICNISGCLSSAPNSWENEIIARDEGRYGKGVGEDDFDTDMDDDDFGAGQQDLDVGGDDGCAAED